MKVFYHNDLDGHCAAFWCTFIPESKKEYFEINYNKPFPIGKILPNETVYIVDFSISPEEMIDLLEITPNVVWIDHHKSSIDKYKNFRNDIAGIRYETKNDDEIKKEPNYINAAGCALTYIYLNIMTNQGKLKNEKNIDLNIKSMYSYVPLFTKLISDWDTWSLKLPQTKPFVIGCEIYNTNPESTFWLDLMNNEQRMVNKIVDEGKICIAYRDGWSKDFLKSYGFEVNFEGYKCFAANLGKCNSDYFKSIGGTDKYDILLPFIFDGKNWSVSLYSKDKVDVSEIAKKYGGGGHKNAAGFISTKIPFKKEK